ncbi:hypothetical protein RA086_02315 [Lactiplantibacillus sp. WILCCON 0030]|uniref:Uncharacterized protein n=1 Tax=Lactiplantibacillus brownii TaxID=3069269 RepID=A0ABU1A6B6_9LACO|nr:hypothetical protein [Lactiplantibacillus brownii]MDQ7936479.1 hypothetical protein [Lactiplantibacillus brownii]
MASSNKVKSFEDLSIDEGNELAEGIMNSYLAGKFDKKTKQTLDDLGEEDDIHSYEYLSLLSLYYRLNHCEVVFINETKYQMNSDDRMVLMRHSSPEDLREHFKLRFGNNVALEVREFGAYALVYRDKYYRMTQTFGEPEGYTGYIG